MTDLWWRHVGRAAALGLLWGVIWAALGALWQMLADPQGSVRELWLGPAIGLAPGILGGILFATLLTIAAPRSRLAQLPHPTAFVAGATAGLLVGLLPFAINEPPAGIPLLKLAAVVLGCLSLAGGLSAAVAVALGRLSPLTVHPSPPAR